MPTPEEERRKRGLLERAIASFQGAGEGAARIAGNTFDSIASPLGEAVKDIRDRFTPTPAGSVEAQAFLDDSEYGPPASLNKLGSAVSTPPVQPVAAGDPMRPAATEEPKPQPPVSPKRLGPALRGGRTQSEMWRLPGAEPVDLEGGDPVANKLKPETILAYAETPSADISSNRGLGERGGLSFAVGNNPGAAGAGLVGPNTPPQLGGGDLVDSWNEVKTAQEELGSFSDSAGKWWSVLLAAMFPQYGSVLNMIGGMKENKYKAARDKYATAFDSLHRKPNYMEVDNRVWDPATRQFLTEKTSKDKYVNYYADTPEGVKVKRAKENEDFDPYYTIPGKQYQGPTLSGAPIDEKSDDEKYPYVDPSSFRTTFREGAIADRATQAIDARAEAADKLARHQTMLAQMREGIQARAERRHADLKDYISAASYMAAKSLSEDLSLIGASPEKLDAALMERTRKYAAQMKAEQQESLGGAPTPGGVSRGSTSGNPTVPATRVAR